MSFTHQRLSFSIPKSTSIRRFLAIPELLHLVFCFLDGHSNTINARVSKMWSDVALPTIWKDIHDLWRLVSLLAPLKKRQDSVYQLAFPPQVTDWLRFSRYASLVRRLHYNIHAPTHKHLHHSVFDEIARTRLHLRVFPNLHTLEWITGGMNDMKMSVVFMHDRVKHFIVWVPFEKQIHLDRASPTPYFHDVAARMPKLTHLDLRMDVPSSLVTAPVINLLTSLAALETVIFPNYHITSEILTSLSTLPYLGIILFEWDSDQGDGSLDDVQTVTPTLSQGAFPALWDLSLTSTLRDMRRFFELPFAPVNLTNLYVDCPCLQSVEVVGGFLKSVAENCQMLKALCLELRWADFTGSHTTRENRITFETIKPLLECPNLVEFKLTHDHAVGITQSDIETLASNWPSLETFTLACQPTELATPSTLTLLALLPFARHCSTIRSLGLFINASGTESSPPTSSSFARVGAANHDIKRFKKLTTLSVGVSHIEDEGAVALFLSRLCPLGCEIECGVTSNSNLEDRPADLDDDNDDSATGMTPAEFLKEVNKRRTKWCEVQRLLPLLTRSRMEERELRSALVDEVEDLRVQNHILLEKEKKCTDRDRS